MRHVRTTVVATIVASLGVFSYAQTPSSPQVFRASTRLVQVTVVVTQSDGQPIRGLTKDDFRILEDGREQTVALFSSSERSTSAAAPTEPGVFTNRLHAPSSGGVVAIVWDRLNTLEEDGARVRTEIIRYLKRAHPDDRIALYVLDRAGMRVIHDFTRDASSLLRFLERVAIGADGGFTLVNKPEFLVTDAIDRAMEEFVTSSYDNMTGAFERDRALTSIEGMEWAAARLAGIHGRKNLVWVSSGFPFTFRAFGPPGSTEQTQMSHETRRATRALSSADVVVYAVDARGLVGAFSSRPNAKTQTFHTLSSVYTPIDGIRYFAEWTGGAAYFNTNDLATAIGRAVADSAHTYTLAYYPSNEKSTHRFRNISVKVKRSGAKVRHRTGYFAADGDDKVTRDSTIEDALRSPLEATGLTLSATARPTRDNEVEVAIHVFPWDIRMDRTPSGWSGNLDLVIAQRVPAPAKGTEEHWKELDLTMPVAANDAERDRLEAVGMRLTRTVRLRDGADQIRIVVRDGSTGAVGSLMIQRAQIGSH